MPEEIDENGEVTETTEEEREELVMKLSERAAAGIERPEYWRRVEGVMGDGGPDYELAFFNAQAEIPAMIEADKSNPHFKSKYASLAGILERVRPILTKHRLTIKQHVGRIHRLGTDTGKQMFLPVLTTLTHVDSGQGETFPSEMPITQLTPVGLGSLITTGKRYSICGIFGIATVDDDGAATMIRNKIENEQSASILDTMIAEIKATKTVAALVKWRKENDDALEIFNEEKMTKLVAAYEEHRGKLQDAEDTQDTKPKGKGEK